MAPLLDIVDTDTIRVVGRWCNDIILRCLHTSV